MGLTSSDYMAVGTRAKFGPGFRAARYFGGISLHSVIFRGLGELQWLFGESQGTPIVADLPTDRAQF